MHTTRATPRVGRFMVFGVILATPIVMAGCNAGALLAGLGKETPTGLAGDVAAKADEVAQRIGGVNGFGGMAQNGYRSQMPNHMGFHGMSDLADPNGHMSVEFRNQSSQNATFRLVYLSSSAGLADQVMDVTVPAGAEQTVEMPCSEILGLGSLASVGAVAAEWVDGTTFDNRMCVPGFMGSDFQCDSGTYRCYLAPDADDLNGNGDTQELIVTTDAMWQHRTSTGMMGGPGPMMGSSQP